MKSAEKRLKITDLEGVRKVVLGQFALHEIEHPQRREDPVPVIPRAHRMADIYKCLHQATFGYYKHIPSREFFREHLAKDYFGVAAKPGAGVLEPVSCDDSVFRVNLRPYKAEVRGHDREGFSVLEKVVLESSLIEKGSRENFFETLDLFKELNLGGIEMQGVVFQFPEKIVDRFLAEFHKFIEIHDVLPLFSHSETYHSLIKPAYVIADLAVIERSPLKHFL